MVVMQICRFVYKRLPMMSGAGVDTCAGPRGRAHMDLLATLNFRQRSALRSGSFGTDEIMARHSAVRRYPAEGRKPTIQPGIGRIDVTISNY